MRFVKTCLVACGTVIVVTSTALAQSDITPRTAASFMGGAGSTSSKTGVWVLAIRRERPYIGGGPGNVPQIEALTLLPSA